MGSIVMPDCVLAHKMQARGPLVAFVCAAVFGLMMLVDPSVLEVLPRPVFAGLVLFIGLSLMGEAASRTREQLCRFEKVIVIVVVWSVVVVGFMPAVALGLILGTYHSLWFRSEPFG